MRSLRRSQSGSIVVIPIRILSLMACAPNLDTFLRLHERTPSVYLFSFSLLVTIADWSLLTVVRCLPFPKGQCSTRNIALAPIIVAIFFSGLHCDGTDAGQIRCDRRDPCANCRDANTTCRRDRQRQPRKVREQPLSHLGKAVNEIHARISGLECSMNGLLSKQKGEPNSLENRENYIPSATVKFGKGHGENVDCRQSRTTRKMALARDFTSADMKSKKRSSVVAFGFDDHRSPSSRASNYGYGNEKIPDSAPFFVVSEACMTIERHLQASEDLSENKRAVFCTALDSLGQTLDASRYDLETSSCSDTSSSRSSTASESHTLPSVEMTDWMLRSFTTKEQIYQPFDHHPFISRSTVMKMTRDILNNGDLADTTSVVCVSSFAAYFLEEILLRTKESSGLEDIMQNKLKTFHGIARNGISRMNMLGPASLARLQALICGAINAQNVGDLTTSWSLGTAASNTCLALGLNREGNTFSKTGGDTAREALYCMAFCYIHDKGLAMNLVRPPCLQDAYIEIDFTALPPTHDRIPSIYQVFAKFAKIQSSLIQDKYADRSMISQKVKHKIATRHLVELKETWPLIEKIRAEIEGIVGKEPTYQCLAAEYAYHTLHTALLHWQSGLPTSSYMNDICLTSARAALKVIKQLGDTLRTGPELWSSSVVSFLHW